ncbi:lysylphosphatidylglycerol synthase domain-containing protein [Sabulicella glaciei]|uniref:Lysylphosphatidylglycerol synthase domain-containing protein n=1 Tax=Sabulicella glaciei TaxID=2984948 RepID=A0ABT3NVR9_9PROT|nr:lysylphosphatidylglycerol synthase domain-containing protein [Roseococcus sp. MDT2-1-1]MCW8085973.1 lysylphosphatidylglycerol synthase domain-containing protein [Roseococcus sp. MDT2-1-1]
MRLGIAAFTLAGFALAAWLVARNDAALVWAAFAAVGVLGLALCTLIRAAILWLCALGWGRLLGGAVAAGPIFAIRFIREAVNVLLPVATVGGEILGARLLTFRGVPAGMAGASTLADLLIQAVGQAIFALTGLVLLVSLAGHSPVTAAASWGLAVAALALLGFFLAQRLGGVGLVERGIAALARRAAGRDGGAEGIGLQEGLTRIWADRPALRASFALHLLAWFLGTLEIWLAARFMGLDLSLAEALVIESLAQALRGAAFPVPGGVGVQEGGFVILGAFFGVAPEAALALSFVKRVPDIALGLPGLALWHRWEMRRAG